jgi:hypothetical protein
MSAMSYREPNEVRWVGVRPAHKGTQVAFNNTANNSTIPLHDVPSGKTFFLAGFTCNVNKGTGGGNGYLTVRDVSNVAQYHLVQVPMFSAGHATYCMSFVPPFEIPSGWDITIISDTAGLGVSAFIYGWEE